MSSDTQVIHQQLDHRFACIADLEAAAKRRMPKFAFDYLQGGIGDETALARNRASLDAICLRARHIVEDYEPELKTKLLGQTYATPDRKSVV